MQATKSVKFGGLPNIKRNTTSLDSDSIAIAPTPKKSSRQMTPEENADMITISVMAKRAKNASPLGVRKQKNASAMNKINSFSSQPFATAKHSQLKNKQLSRDLRIEDSLVKMIPDKVVFRNNKGRDTGTK